MGIFGYFSTFFQNQLLKIKFGFIRDIQYIPIIYDLIFTMASCL